MRVEVVPGKLFVSLFEHQMARAPGRYWSFVSEGLKALGQQEIVFTLKTLNEEEREAPRDVFQYFAVVHQLASQGRVVYAGGLTGFGPAGFIIPSWRGLLYAEAEALPGVTMPSGALTAIAVDEQELQIAQQVTGYRILSRLGKVNSYFPFTPWSDRGRASVAHQDDPQSLFFRAPTICLQGASLLFTEDKIKLNLSKRAAQQFAGLLPQIPESAGFAVVTQPSTTASGWLVWEPGQNSPFAITPPDGGASRLAGYALLLALGQPADQASLYEDGFSMMMRADTWARLKDALTKEQSCAFETENLTLQVNVISESYHNPVDYQEYVAPGGWKTYAPSGAEAHPNSRIVLLCSEEELKTGVEVNALAAFTKEVMELLEGSVLARGARLEVYLQFELQPGQRASLQTLCKPEQELPRDLMRQVMSVKAPAVKNRISFQIIQRFGFDR